MAVEGAPSRGQTLPPAATLLLAERRQVFFHFTQRRVHGGPVGKWVPCYIIFCIFLCLKYVIIFKRDHDFLHRTSGENGIPVAQNCHNSCVTLSHHLTGLFWVFNQHNTGQAGSPLPYLRNDLKIVRWLSQKSVAGSIVFNFQNSLVSNCLSEALEGLEITFYVLPLIHEGGLLTTAGYDVLMENLDAIKKKVWNNIEEIIYLVGRNIIFIVLSAILILKKKKKTTKIISNW